MRIKHVLLILVVICKLAIGAQTRADIDALVATYMTNEGVAGLTLAIAKGGQLVYAKGYGDTVEKTPAPSSLLRSVTTETKFRIASLSKAFTGVGMMKLLEQGRFGASGLHTKVFGPGSIFGDRYKPAAGYGSDLLSLELVHLLEHTAGLWQPEDPMFFGDGKVTSFSSVYTFPSAKYDFIVATNPQNWSQDTLISYVVSEVSANTSQSNTRFWKTAYNTSYDYSNFNYCLLGRVIEVVTGRTYEDYVQDEILKPIGITGMYIAGTGWSVLPIDETNYGSDNAFHYNFRRFDSHGGWVATAKDLLSFGTRARGTIISADTWDNTMLVRASAVSSQSFKKGWWVSSRNGVTTVRGEGSMPGTRSVLLLEGDMAVAIVVNRQCNTSPYYLATDIIDLNTAWDTWSVSSTYVNDGEWQVAYTGGSGGWTRIGHAGTLLNHLRFADFNGDGKADIFRRDDDGSWYVAYVDAGTSGWTYLGSSTNCDLSTMAFGDFNGDGKCDIFMRGNDGSWYVFYVNTGATGWTYIGHSTSCDMSTMRFADFNGDGKCDIFKRDADGKWYVAYVNSGTSGWTYIGYSTSCDLSTMAFADFNGDGKCDIFKRDADGSWYVAYVDGGTSGWTFLGGSTGCDMSNMVFADFNGDGKCDIFKRDSDGKWYVVYVNIGPTTWQYLGSSDTALDLLRFADFNGDGKVDVFRKLENLTQLASCSWTTIGYSNQPLSKLRFADFDGDGKTDVFLRDDDGKWYVYYVGSLKTGWHYIGYSTSCDLTTMAFGDFNGDGKCDIFKRDPDGKWYVAYVDGGTSGWTYIGYSTSCDMSTMRFADFNGDGKCDIFKRDPDGKWYVAYVDGGTSGWTYIGYSTSCDLSTMAFADFNGDGKCDIFKRDTNGKRYVAYVDGGTSGWTYIGYSTSCDLSTMRFADFDGDGKADVFRKYGNSWQVCRTGTSGWQTIGSSSIALEQIAFGDFNGDGKTDLFTFK